MEMFLEFLIMSFVVFDKINSIGIFKFNEISNSKVSALSGIVTADVQC